MIPLDFYVISDTHFFDPRLRKFLGRPDQVDVLMRQNWDVPDDESILHLGDLVMPASKEAFKRRVLPSLTGKKYLIRGNHDTLEDSFYQECGFELLEPFAVEKDGWLIHFTHYPMAVLGLNEVNVHGHIHNTQVDQITRNHFNMSVEVRNYTPWYTGDFVTHMIARAAMGDTSGDFAPDDPHHHYYTEERFDLASDRMQSPDSPDTEGAR